MCLALTSPTYSAGEPYFTPHHSPIIQAEFAGETSRILTEQDAAFREYFSSDVVVCSNIKSLTASNFQEFYLENKPFGNTQIDPKFMAIPRSDVRYSIFVASNGEVDGSIQDCLDNFPSVVAHDIKEKIGRQSHSIVSGSRMMGDELLPDIYAAPKASWEYYTARGGIEVRSLVSIEDEPYRSLHAVAYFFGFDERVCEDGSTCKAFIEEQ